MALNTRLDKKKARDSVIELQLKETAEAALNGKMDAAKQKEALLSYVGYVNARHEEVLSSLEKGQEKERYRLRTYSLHCRRGDNYHGHGLSAIYPFTHSSLH